MPDGQIKLSWKPVCTVADLVNDSGVCVLVESEQVQKHIALFARDLSAQMPKLYAVGNYDPIGKASVLSRGIAGSINDEPVVASPLYKQHYSLVDGRCLEDETVKIPVYQVKIEQDQVYLQLA